jgi:hypothetical protein
MSMAPVKRRRILRLLLSIGSLLFAVICVEIGLRLLLPPMTRVQRITDDPLLGWDSQPAVAELENRGSPRKVYFLGDSFTQDRTWPARTQRHAAEAGVFFDGYVLGVSGYGTTQSLLKLERDFDRHRPELVLLLFFAWNDLRDNVASPAIFYSPTTRTRPYLVASSDGIRLEPAADLSPATWLLYHTEISRRALLKLLMRAGDAAARVDVDGMARWNLPFAVNYTERATWEPFYRPGPSGDYVAEAYRVTAEAFRRMHQLLRTRGAKLGVIGIDNPFVVDDDVAEQWVRRDIVFDADQPLRRMAEILAREGIPFVSATPALRAERARLNKKMYNPPAGELSGHLEPEGEAVVARLAAAMAVELLAGGAPADGTP